jgi:hypothetical protein
MKGYKTMRTIIFTLLALAMSASAALAIQVNINGTPHYSADPTATYDFIQPSDSSWDGGNDKINIVDYILKGRLDPVDHTYTLINPTGTWFANGGVSIIIDEIAGYANTNTFGYYTMDGHRTEIFSGIEDKNTPPHTFPISPAAEFWFGFYLGVPNTSLNTFYYTEASRNVHNEIHAAIFQVDNSNTYILGFEDLRLCNTDADYQDMIVKVTINQVPEPSTMLLVGTGLIGLGLLRRRFKK